MNEIVKYPFVLTNGAQPFLVADSEAMKRKVSLMVELGGIPIEAIRNARYVGKYPIENQEYDAYSTHPEYRDNKKPKLVDRLGAEEICLPGNSNDLIDGIMKARNLKQEILMRRAAGVKTS